MEIVLFISVVALVFMLLEMIFPDHEEEMIERLEGFKIYNSTEHDRKMNESLFQRIYSQVEAILIRRFGNYISRGGALAPLKLKLYQAGSKIEPIQHRTKRYIFALGLGGLSMMTYNYKLVIIMVVIGFIFPDYQLSRKINERKFLISEQIPDFCDILAAVFPGCNSLDDAIIRICRRSDSLVAREFQNTIDEINANVNRKEAFRALATRCGVPAIDTLIGQIIQTEMLGSEMAETLKTQSSYMRELKKRNAEIKARNAGVALVMPSIFLMVTILIVVAGPPILQFLQAMKTF